MWSVVSLRITNPPPSVPRIHSNIHLPIHPSFIYPPTHMSIHLPMYQSIYPPVYSPFLHSFSLHPASSVAFYLPMRHPSAHPFNQPCRKPSLHHKSFFSWLDSKLSQLEHVTSNFKKSSSQSGLEDKVLPETLGMSLGPCPSCCLPDRFGWVNGKPFPNTKYQ